jgi:hypothetical protein
MDLPISPPVCHNSRDSSDLDLERDKSKPTHPFHHDDSRRKDSSMGYDKQPAAGEPCFTLTLSRPLKVLTANQICQIDDALARLGPFAEVRLIKNRGKLRFIQKVDSESVLGPTD